MVVQLLGGLKTFATKLTDCFAEKARNGRL